jgi:hypothetical protein
MSHNDLRKLLPEEYQGTKVAAVLDWELSGYYPEYWEYVKALYRPAWKSSWIKKRVVDQILNLILWN